MNKTLVFIFLILSLTCFVSFADARKIYKAKAHQKREVKDLGCKCQGRAALRCGLCKSEEAKKCRKQFVRSCNIKCSVAKKCKQTISEKCAFFTQGSVHYKRCARLTAAKECLGEIDTTVIEGCKCGTFAVALCGVGKDSESKECRKLAVGACKKQCTGKREGGHKRRICISPKNCDCKKVAKEACHFAKDSTKCLADKEKACKLRCTKDTQCFPLCCKNAGHKRCKTIVEKKCSTLNGDAKKKCICEKTQECRSYALGTCFAARRLFKWRSQCSSFAEKKCGELDGEDKCKCLTKIRGACLKDKEEHRIRYIRRYKCCRSRSVLLCNDKEPSLAKKCRAEEYAKCEREIEAKLHLAPPECVSLASKHCGGKTTGKCFTKRIRKCVKTSCNFCVYKNWKNCKGDYDCLVREQANCKPPVCHDCKDNNKCTYGVCHPKKGCTHVAKSCNDKNKCTEDKCDPNVGCVNIPKNCDDGIPCTKDSCDPVSGLCVHTPDDSKCVATKDCHISQCTAKGCVEKKTATCCTKGAKQCRDEICKTCETLKLGLCDERIECKIGNDGEAQCIRQAKVCKDGKTCTIGYCDTDTGKCVHQRKNTPECICLNQPCDTTSPVCDANEDCTAWGIANKYTLDNCKYAYCNATAGICGYKNLEGCITHDKCKDKCKNIPCNTVSKCKYNANKEIVCDVTNPCDDGNACTKDSCGPDNRCIHENIYDEVKCPVICTNQTCCTDFAISKGYVKDCKKAVLNIKDTTCTISDISDISKCKHRCHDDNCCKKWGVGQKLHLNCQTSTYDKNLKKCVVQDVPNKNECLCNLNCAPKDKCHTAKAVISGGKCKCVQTRVQCVKSQDSCSVGHCNVETGACEYSAGNCECKTDACCKQLGQTYNLTFCETLVYSNVTGGCVAISNGDCLPPPPICDLNCQPRHKCERARCQAKDGKYVCVRKSINCDDGLTCTQDSCDLKTGQCVNTFIPGYIPTNSACCRAKGISQNLQSKCQTLIYNPGSKTCDVVTIQNNNGNSNCPPPPNCNCAPQPCQNVTCVNQVCVYNAIDCDDGVKCTKDSCDVNSGQCVHVPIPGCCSDDVCCQAQYANSTVTQDCKQVIYDKTSSSCKVVPITDRPCTPPPQCDITNCVPVNNCDQATCVQNADGSYVCQHSTRTCNDGINCTQDYCDLTTGQCVHKTIQGAKCCQDQTCCDAIGKIEKVYQNCKKYVFNTQTKTCDQVDIEDSKLCQCNKNCVANGLCDKARCVKTQGGYACQHSPVCDDGIACTLDSCNSTTGQCNFQFISGCVCTDQACCNASAAAISLDQQCLSYTYNNITGKCDVTPTAETTVCPPPPQLCQLLDCQPTGPCDNATCVVSADGTSATCVHTPNDSPSCHTPVCNCQPRNKCEYVVGCTSDDNGQAVCQYKQINCDDGKNCTVDYCDLATGECQNHYVQKLPDCPGQCKKLSDCQLLNLQLQQQGGCKAAICDLPSQSCKIVNDTTSNCFSCQKNCKAYNKCDTAVCQKNALGVYVCQHTPVAVHCDDGVICTKDYCDLKTGNCVHEPVTNNALCPKGCGCKIDSDCVNSACSVTQNLDNCHQAYCDTKLGTCKVQVKPGSNCGCSSNSDCPQGTYGSVCVSNSTGNTCIPNQCQFSVHCQNSGSNTVCTCQAQPAGNKECVCQPVCQTNADCNDNNPCTADICWSDRGICEHVAICDDQNACTVDSCVASADLKTATCVHKLRSCTCNSTLYYSDYSTLSPAEQAQWVGQCDKSLGCVSQGNCCVQDVQCDDHNGCTVDTCQSGQCQNALLDNIWCDPKTDIQPIWYQADPALRTALSEAGYDVSKLVTGN